MRRLQEGEASVSELAAPFGMTLPGVSKHIRILEDAGLVFKRREGRTLYCSLTANPLREIDSWLERFRTGSGRVPPRTSRRTTEKVLVA